MRFYAADGTIQLHERASFIARLTTPISVTDPAPTLNRTTSATGRPVTLPHVAPTLAHVALQQLDFGLNQLN